MDISRTMRAIVAYGPSDYRLQTVPVPQIGAGELLVKIEACGICASDLKCFHGAARFWGGQGPPAFVKAPVIAGHEFVGHVVKIGSGLEEQYQVGDRVVADQIVPCTTCRFCKTGNYYMCEQHDIFGFQSHVNGGMAEFIKFPANALIHKVPPTLALEKAVLIEPFSCSKHCVDRARISYEDVVVLAGLGPLGLGMVGFIKLHNPAKLIVLDLKDERRQMALDFGADWAWDPREVNVAEEIKSLTDGYGCDVYIEATGHKSGVQQGLDMLRRMGTFVEVSVFGEPATVDWSIIGNQKELNVYGAHLSPYCYRPVIEWLANGKIPAAGVVTDKLPLEKFAEGFKLMERGENSIKVVLCPDM